MKKIRKQEIIPLILFGIFIISMLYIIVYKRKENKSLTDNLEYSKCCYNKFSLWNANE